jgi:HD-GYP domain-containing protein (c-di-GMP phosphodiesterase class II)
MFTKLLKQLNIKETDLIRLNILTQTALNELNKFYERIEKFQKDPAFADKHEHYSYSQVIPHSRKVAAYSLIVAQAFSERPASDPSRTETGREGAGTIQLTDKECYEIGIAGFLHDVDKIYWPTQLLDKPKLEMTKSDWTRIMEHAVASSVLMERVARKQISPNIITIIKQHHENLNGTGYPNRTAGADICTGARIIRVTDSYDSMTSPRPYKTNVFTHEKALQDITNKVGSAYDAEMVKLFTVHLPPEKIAGIVQSVASLN